VWRSDPEVLSYKLTTQYRKLTDYMGDTGLVINDDKTHLIVMGRKNSEQRKLVKVETGTVTVTPVATEKLFTIQEEITRSHSLVSCLELQLSRNATFKTRLMVANSAIMSLFTYIITVWGDMEDYIIKAAQVIQNRAARIVTKHGWFTSQKILLHDTNCNWLSIRQMIFYHTILQIWRVRKTKRPQYLSSIFNPDYNNQTRVVTAGNLRVPLGN
jgi:hypothetical protein